MDSVSTGEKTSLPAGKPAEKPRGKSGVNKADLGISRVIYATGYAFKDSIIAMGAIAGSLILALTAGRKIPMVKPAAEFIMKLPERSMAFIKGIPVQDIPGIGKPVHDGITYAVDFFRHNGKVIGGSIGAGWAISHIVMGPSWPVGFRKAQAAVDKYDAAVRRNDRLAHENAGLTEENMRLKKAGFAAAEKTPAAVGFSERVAADQASVQAGAAR